MKRIERATKYLVIVAIAYALAACGGGENGSGIPPASETMMGVAAAGQPIENGLVQILCARGATLNATTNNSGFWQVAISGQTPPCVLEISGGTINSLPNSERFHSIATRFGTTNITPLTDLMSANVAGSATPANWFADLTPSSLATITNASISAALSKQCAALSGLTPLCATNPITTVFTPTYDNVMDNMLLALKFAALKSGVSYVSLLNNAAVSEYSAPSANFNVALLDAYVATTSAISAVAIPAALNLTVGTAMNAYLPIQPIGGTPPYSFLYSGTLPEGIIFDTGAGLVMGTPTSYSPSENIIFSVKDANDVIASTTSTVSFSITNWSATGNLNANRGGHTATKLSDGSVLIVGGTNGTALDSAEIYNTATGLFTSTGSMHAARFQHTATRLQNGMVLVTGGIGATFLKSAELYDPGTGKFTATKGNMNSARAYHTATLLPDGNVLIVGGTPNLVTGLDTAELYDPTSGLFTLTTGTMATSRTQHTATLLGNGLVLVCGGVTATAELYDPTKGTFTSTGSMTASRTSHSATRLRDNNVLVVGGLGGLATAELYDPSKGKFTSTGSMTALTRYQHTATLLENSGSPDYGKVLIAGGTANGSTGLTSTELYDPATGRFATAGALLNARVLHAATLLNSGMVLVTGGATAKTSELYQ